MLPRDELRKLFELRKCASDTHDSVDCERCPKKAEMPPGFANPDEAPSGASMLAWLRVRPLHPCPAFLRLRRR